METNNTGNARRILIVDDNRTIHEDIRKILCPAVTAPELLEAEAKLFGTPLPVSQSGGLRFQIDSAMQGQDALALVQQACAEGVPHMLAFVDVRMPPGWDGIQTARKLWEVNSGLQIVICTAFSDHSWDDIVRSLGQSDNFVILKKPFDNIEVLQLAHALTQKWMMTEQAGLRMKEMDQMVAQKTAEITASNEQLRAEVGRRSQAEMELRGSEHRFELAFKASAIPMAMMHATTETYLEVNESFIRLLGRSRDEIIGKTAKEIGLLARPEDCDNAMTELRRAGSVRDYAVRLVPKTGEPRDTLVSLEPVVLFEEMCVLVAILDVTEQKKLEVQLRQSQKMEAIGQLAAGVAHDFNNLLTIIHGHASLQIARPRQDEKLGHSLNQIKMAADRAATLTRQLLAFSRKQMMQLKPVSLNDSIERSQALLKRLIGETIKLTCDCSPILPMVFADENSIDQVVLNLVVNARDAMPEGGNLRVTTNVVEVLDAEAGRHPEARPGRFVRLSVEDNGCGMDTSVRTRIFEPFYTTKPKGKGTGLGLSTVYGIVKQHEGWVEVESAVGLGSKFHVFLAITDKLPENKGETAFFQIQPAPAKQHETVLVVEDEIVLREFVTAVLMDQGYNVLEAGDGMEALEVARQTEAKIDLLLTDMVMPNGISGKMLASQLVAQRNGLKVLFMSGYSRDLVDNSNNLVSGVNFLPKPFDVAKLLKAVRSCLEAETPSEVRTTDLVGVNN